MAKDLAGLPSYVGSRSEQFLNHIVGRSTDLDALPAPNSRIEEYLEYIAYKGVGGGEYFNKITQSVNSIDFKNGEVKKAELEIITEDEINNIIISLT